MIDGNFFATQFYADVDGHPEDRNLAFALEELKFFSREFRIVGVYPGHPFRATFTARSRSSYLSDVAAYRAVILRPRTLRGVSKDGRTHLSSFEARRRGSHLQR